jgi:hypothetical protein
MPDEFRFLVICRAASLQLDEPIVNLTDVVNHLEVEPGESTGLIAAVGCVLRPEMEGKHLDLMAWRLGKNGEPERFADYVGTPLILPEQTGPAILPLEIALPITERGIYGFYLFDREGVFASPESLLATYMFSASILTKERQ